MKICTLEFLPKAKEDLALIKRSGDKSALNKVVKLLEELKNDPRTGTGKAERLKHYEEEVWSRRINDKHRLVYQIFEDKIQVLVLSAYGHYDDK